MLCSATPRENPYLHPGFHSDEDVHDTSWLEEAQRTWSGGLSASVLADAARVLATVILHLPPDPDEDLPDAPEAETEPGSATACLADWIM